MVWMLVPFRLCCLLGGSVSNRDGDEMLILYIDEEEAGRIFIPSDVVGVVIIVLVKHTERDNHVR